jgi:hypothetical protein
VIVFIDGSSMGMVNAKNVMALFGSQPRRQ